MDGSALMEFMRARRADLERLVGFHRDFHDADELAGEIWLAADEMEREWGSAIDLTSPVHQSALLADLQRRLARGADRLGRRTSSLNRPISTAHGGSELIDLLPSDDHDDPETQLCTLESFTEDRVRLSTALASTYSQAAAYMHLLDHGGGQLSALALLLRIGLATLKRRLAKVIGLHAIQARLFDGVSHLDLACLDRFVLTATRR